MTSNETSSVAFFGATGGCTNACLVHALNAGIHATALARTPSKLTSMLAEQGVSESVIGKQLTIVQGDIADLSAIKSVLFANPKNNSAIPPRLVSYIVSGVGGTPRFQMSLQQPMTIDNPEICATTTRHIIQALQELEHELRVQQQQEAALIKPLIIVISTTGISDKEDVPFGFRFFYHHVLAVPHVDKKVMEQLVATNLKEADQANQVFRGAVFVRPSLLVGDHLVKGGKGWKALRVGTEDEPAVGYTIHRADVGQWIFEEVLRTGGEAYLGWKVTLTS